ncbi:MAG: HEPN domain-containing protein [Phascolarctobacterium sp.]|nr:HEPN domain-containing protein [Phascolarctobacterium sp.]
MEGSVIELSQYRLLKAKEVLRDAELMFENESFASAVNRAYYALFHCLRAVTDLDSYDSSKHSGIISFFNKTYVKTGVFDKEVSKILDKSFRIREKADYDDFIVITEQMAEEQIVNTRRVLQIIEPYLTARWNKL